MDKWNLEIIGWLTGYACVGVGLFAGIVPHFINPFPSSMGLWSHTDPLFSLPIGIVLTIIGLMIIYFTYKMDV